ncbi:MAG: rhamnogalacturonan acetylesterase [Pedobacter sp.]|nr:MAG: rhamnogalacturonan acetylesterase [Pedobacter sp.]
MKLFSSLILLFAMLFLGFKQADKKPTLYIIGDSTVRNGDGTGKGSLWGWGSVISPYFDTNQIAIRNHAMGGRSSRTFITEGRWETIMKTLSKGDYVIMQFGHNDASPLDDTARARGTIKGVGNDSVATYNPIRKMNETVYSYGYYLRKYVNEAKSKGAIPIICSPVPRESWKKGKIDRTEYSTWSKQIADETGAYFIPLNELIATTYEGMDTASVHTFFPTDHTHTNLPGAELNARKVKEGIEALPNCTLRNYLRR